jgi:hypothetical protein
MKKCGYMKETDWDCYIRLNPDIVTGDKWASATDEQRYQLAAQDFNESLSRGGVGEVDLSPCRCQLLTEDQALEHACSIHRSSDWNCYLALNSDIHDMCNSQLEESHVCAKEHFQHNGKEERRQCRCAMMATPAQFDVLHKLEQQREATYKCSYNSMAEWHCYLLLNEDLDIVFSKTPGCEGLNKKKCAMNHYIANVLNGPETDAMRPCKCSDVIKKLCKYTSERDWDCYLKQNEAVSNVCSSGSQAANWRCAKEFFNALLMAGGEKDAKCQCAAREPCEGGAGKLRGLCGRDRGVDDDGDDADVDLFR